MKIDFIETAAALRSFLSSEIEIDTDADMSKAFHKISKRFLTHLSAELGLKRCKLKSFNESGTTNIWLVGMFNHKIGLKIHIQKHLKTLNLIKYHIIYGLDDNVGGPTGHIEIQDLSKPVQIIRELSLTLKEKSNI